LTSRFPLSHSGAVNAEGAGGEQAHPSPARARLPWVALAAVILLSAALRVHLLQVPFERDEGEYAYAGQLMLDGVAPFDRAYNMKLPGTYAAYAVSMAVFGQSTAGARIGLLLVNAASIALLFLLARKLLGTGGALATATSYAFLSLSATMLGPFGHATHFVVLPAVAGALVLTTAVEPARRRRLFASGLLLGLAFLMKQPGFVFPLFGLGWLAWARLRPGGEGARGLLPDVAVFLVGAAAPLAVTVAALAAAGVLDRFYFWVVQYAREYASTVSLRGGLRNLAHTSSRIAAEHGLLLALAAAGLVMQAVPRLAIRHRAFLLGFLALSLLGVCPGLYFRGHYFLLALPAVCLLVGAAYQGVEALAAAPRSRAAVRGVALGFVAFASVLPILGRADLYFRASPDRVSREIYGVNPFPESVEIARYIRERSDPQDTVAVLGSEPQIYFYSGRRSATGHIYTYALMEPQPLARAMQEEMIRQIEAARPAYVVWIAVQTSWLARPDSVTTLFSWADRFLAAGYDVCGEIAILGPDHTEYRWEHEARELPPGVPGAVVLRRRGFVPRARPSAAR
jgi:4-amino-4-deoxy-L-arabinose transferase-like glycosyltransferase